LIGRGNARIRLNQLDGALDDAEAAATQAAEQKVQLTDKLLYNLARIYAQVAGQRLVQGQTDGAALCTEKAWQYLVKALNEQKDLERQQAFWRRIELDTAFIAIRAGSIYHQMAERYGRKGP
jgi:hypothetical protein